MNTTTAENPRRLALNKKTSTIWANRLRKSLEERDHYKAHAQRLAEALKAVDYAWTNYRKDYKAIGYETIKMVREALAAWEGAQ